MNNRNIFLLFALLSALTSFADKKMTIRNKEFRDHINAPAVVEEVVEIDECPVELIEE